MNKMILNNQNNFKFKIPIMILSWVAFAFALFSYMLVLYGCSHGIYVFDIEILSYVLNILPYLLFSIYVTKFHNQFKNVIFLPISLGMLLASSWYGIIVDITGMIGIFVFGVLTILATICSLKWMSKKIFIVIFMVIGLLGELIPACASGFYDFLGIRVIGAICMYIALFLFFTQNKVPVVKKLSIKTISLEKGKMSPEQSLRILESNLELGIITEEEYREQRAEIISKL